MSDTARARVFVLVFALACIASTACVAGVLGIVAIVFAGQPIRRATGFDVDFMVSRVWLVGGFGLVIPLMAPVFDRARHLASESQHDRRVSDHQGWRRRPLRPR